MGQNTKKMKFFNGKTRSFIFAVAIAATYGLYSRLWRVKHVRLPKLRVPIIFAHWHGDELFLIGAHIGAGLSAMVSRSQDGEMLKWILQWFGFRVVRGSSTRGGAGGLKGLIDVVSKEGRSTTVAVDGPRGPIYRVKPGIIKLAQETGSPIVCGGAAVSHRYTFQKSWNKCYLPLPFARGAVVYSEPFYIPKGISEAEFEECRLRVERDLTKMKEEAENLYSKKFPVMASA